MIPQSGRISDAIQASVFHLMRLMPSEWASTLGSRFIRWNARANRPEVIAGAKRNLRIHRPAASEAELDLWVDEFLDGVGRVMAEFAVMHRFLREGRIETEGFETFQAIAGTRPIIALMLHTGNWETFAPVCQKAGISLTSIIQPPNGAFERLVAARTRAEFGVNTVYPDRNGIRQAIRALQGNQTLSIFPDEARQGRTMGPLFGRPPHDKGNLAVAARLARITGADLGVGYCRRIAPCRFRLHFGMPFNLPARAQPDLLADVAFLNKKIEPLILENIPRWYFLDDDISGPL